MGKKLIFRTQRVKTNASGEVNMSFTNRWMLAYGVAYGSPLAHDRVANTFRLIQTYTLYTGFVSGIEELFNPKEKKLVFGGFSNLEFDLNWFEVVEVDEKKCVTVNC